MAVKELVHAINAKVSAAERALLLAMNLRVGQDRLAKPLQVCYHHTTTGVLPCKVGKGLCKNRAL